MSDLPLRGSTAALGLAFALTSLAGEVAPAHGGAEAGRLTVRFAPSPEGAPVVVGLFADAGSFDRLEPLHGGVVVPSDAGTEPCWEVEGLAPGAYAVLAFVDLDGDGALARGPRDRPEEPYAVSNAARRAPRFDRARIEFTGAFTTVDLGPWRLPPAARRARE